MLTSMIYQNKWWSKKRNAWIEVPQSNCKHYMAGCKLPTFRKNVLSPLNGTNAWLLRTALSESFVHLEHVTGISNVLLSLWRRRRSGCSAPRILSLDTRWRCVVNFTPRPPYSSGNNTEALLIRGLVDPLEGLGVSKERNISWFFLNPNKLIIEPQHNPYQLNYSVYIRSVKVLSKINQCQTSGKTVQRFYSSYNQKEGETHTTKVREGYQLPPLKVPGSPFVSNHEVFCTVPTVRLSDGLTQLLEHTDRILDTSLEEFSFREPNEWVACSLTRQNASQPVQRSSQV
jgi:hypothetical protein